MIFDFDKIIIKNILQLKWNMHKQIQKNNYLKIFNKIIKLIMKKFINN